MRSWREQLQRYVADLESRNSEPTDGQRAHQSRQASDAAALADFVEQVDVAAEAALAARDWPSAAKAVTGALRRCLGPRRRVGGWNRTGGATSSGADILLEQDAYDAVTGVAATLTELDGVSAPPTAGRILDAIRGGLDHPVPSGTILGRGILVGNADEFAGADLDLLLVVGMTEGSFPAHQREHPILRDADRRKLSPELATVAIRGAPGGCARCAPPSGSSCPTPAPTAGPSAGSSPRRGCWNRRAGWPDGASKQETSTPARNRSSPPHRG